jgi:DamX protein
VPVIAQLPLDQAATSAPATGAVVPDKAAPSIQFEGARQPMPLPLVGEAQPVIRQPLAQAAGLSGAEEGDGAGGESVVDLPAPAPIVPITPAPAAVAAPVVVPEPVKPAPAPAPVPAPAPAKPAAPVVAAQSAAGSGWYATQAGSRFTLQILGSRSEGGAQAFVREHGAEYRYFRKQHQGQPLYVVTYGSFASRDAAQAALRGLPVKVQAGKPWPRNFAGIQQEIAQAR